jgi:hypothetical protein
MGAILVEGLKAFKGMRMELSELDDGYARNGS